MSTIPILLLKRESYHSKGYGYVLKYYRVDNICKNGISEDQLSGEEPFEFMDSTYVLRTDISASEEQSESFAFQIGEDSS